MPKEKIASINSRVDKIKFSEEKKDPTPEQLRMFRDAWLQQKFVVYASEEDEAFTELDWVTKYAAQFAQFVDAQLEDLFKSFRDAPEVTRDELARELFRKFKATTLSQSSESQSGA